MKRANGPAAFAQALAVELKTKSDYYQKYLDYIQAAGVCVSKKSFIEDWEPIGGMVLIQLSVDQKIRVEDGFVFLKRENLLLDDFEPRVEQPKQSSKPFKPRTRNL